VADLQGMRAQLQREFEDLVGRFMASDHGQRLLGWYDQLGDRDRLALRLLGAFLGLVLGYLLLLAPMISYGDQAQSRLQEERSLLAWLRENAGEVQGGAPVNPEARNQPVATLVNSSAQESGLTIRRYEPAGENSVRVWLEGAAFNAVVKWVYQLEGNYGVRATDINIERESEPGKVSARLTLQG